jgi:hypothetical protein
MTADAKGIEVTFSTIPDYVIEQERRSLDARQAVMRALGRCSNGEAKDDSYRLIFRFDAS